MKYVSIWLILHYYLFGDIFDDDWVGTYVNMTIDYDGENCQLKNNNWKKYNGIITVRKEKLQIMFDLNWKNSKCHKKERISSVLAFCLTDSDDKTFELAFISIDDCDRGRKFQAKYTMYQRKHILLGYKVKPMLYLLKLVQK